MLFSVFIHLFIVKKGSFIGALLSEPSEDNYKLPKDLEIDVDIIWHSHKEDHKNLSMDYRAIKNDVSKFYDEYVKIHGEK